MATRMNIYINKSLPTIVGREEPSLPNQDLKICKIVDYVQVGRSAVRIINKGHGGIKKKDYTGYVNTSDLAQMTVTTVPIPANFVGLEAVDVPTRLQYQYFEIYDVVEEENEVVITARHIWYQNLQNNTLWKPEANTSYSASAVCRNVMNEAMFETDFDVASDCTDTLPSEELDFERKNIVEAFLDPENGICKKFGLSLIRDNYRFYCLKNVGYDRGFVVQYGKNLLGVEREESIENVATRIAPFGKNSKGEIVWLDNNGQKYIDSQYIGNYSSPRLEMLDTGLQIGKDGVTADNIQAKLLEMAQKRFSEDEVDKPEVTMEIEFISLGDTEEYQQYRDLDKVYLYDIITIKDEEKGYNYSAQVIGIEHDILTGMLNSVTIGSLKQADASRKIAVWQVPEIDGANIRLLSIQAGSFVPESIQNADLAPLIITADKIVSGEIDTRHLKAESITSEKIQAEAITTGKLASGAITTEKLSANAVTASKIDADAVTTEKLAANSVTADKISTVGIEAINAKLGTASIANAQIATADINFAHIKDLNAQSAFFGQTIFNEAVGGKLYVPRLSVGYAQMVGATIGDLVIQASDGNYYGIDVDMAGNVTATQRTVSASEIASGHTTDGRTLVLGTDILATDLNTENIYASHALMNEITASIINVDQLFAREATISKINALDLSSNTYIRSTIGNWDSGSTITQTVNTLVTRIGELGYGTVYFQPDEPNHSDLSAGDIWVQSTSTGSWNTVKNDYSSWTEIKNTIGTWQTVGGIPKMFIWDGRFWQEMYDAYLPTSMQTEIEQLASAINLRATREEVDLLSNDVQEFSAELTIQAQEIASAVSAVNLKASSYVMNADPRTAYTVSIGDIWIKRDEYLQSWATIRDNYSTWQSFKDAHLAWKDGLGEETYVWNGSKWILTSDRASEIYQKTLIDQTINQVEILAEASAVLSDELISVSARLTVAIDSITQEVTRAQTAEDSKIAKTTQYQTADQIVSSAQSYVNGILTSKAQIETLATGITAYVEEYTEDNYYGIQSGIEIKSVGIEISGSKYVKIKSGGKFLVDSGNFSISEQGAVTVKGAITSTSGTIGGWSLASKRLSSGSGTNFVGIDSGTTNVQYAMWAGAESPSSAPYRITRSGEVYATKFFIIGENGTEQVVNLRTYGLWKLNYDTIKRWTVSGGTVTIETTGGNINFNSAAGVTLSGGWTDGWTRYTVTAVDSQGNVVGTKSSGAVAADMTNAQIKSALESASNHKAILNIEADGEVLVVRTIDASGVYTLGYNDGSPSSGSASGRAGSSYSWTFRILKEDGSGKNLTIDCSSIYSDARQGYTMGTFNQYSGAQLYTMGQYGPERYTGTLYVKS